jgi:hypothetical protein
MAGFWPLKKKRKNEEQEERVPHISDIYNWAKGEG